MIFRNEEHNNEFVSLVKRMGAQDDVYKLTLAYLLTLDQVCSKHIEEIYNFDDRRIVPEVLGKSWQTSTSLKTTRLAFNLYTGATQFCPEDSIRRLSVADIFSCELAPYYWEGVKLLYAVYM